MLSPNREDHLFNLLHHICLSSAQFNFNGQALQVFIKLLFTRLTVHVCKSECACSCIHAFCVMMIWRWGPNRTNKNDAVLETTRHREKKAINIHWPELIIDHIQQTSLHHYSIRQTFAYSSYLFTKAVDHKWQPYAAWYTILQNYYCNIKSQEMDIVLTQSNVQNQSKAIQCYWWCRYLTEQMQIIHKYTFTVWLTKTAGWHWVLTAHAFLAYLLCMCCSCRL